MGYRLKTYGNLVVVRWVGTPVPGEPTAVYEHLKRTATVLKQPLYYIGIHDTDSREPDRQTRNEAVSGWDEGMAPVEVCYQVLARSNLVAAAQRSFYRAMVAAARALGLRSLGKMHFVATVEEALRKLGPLLSHPQGDLRERMRSDGLAP